MAGIPWAPNGRTQRGKEGTIRPACVLVNSTLTALLGGAWRDLAFTLWKRQSSNKAC